MGVGEAAGVDRVDDGKSSTHRPFGVIFVCLGIAEVNQHTIAHVFGDKAGEAGDGVGDDSIIGADDLADPRDRSARRVPSTPPSRKT